MSNFEKVQLLLSTVCPHDPEEITPEKHLVNDLELDSFGMMDMVIAFEEEYHIDVPDRDLRLFGTVQDIVDYLEKKEMGEALPEL